MFQQKPNGKEILWRRGIERSLIYAARLIPLYLTWFLLPLGSTSADLSCLIAARLWYGTNHLTSWALPLLSVKWNGHVSPLTLGCKWHNICGNHFGLRSNEFLKMYSCCFLEAAPILCPREPLFSELLFQTRKQMWFHMYLENAISYMPLLKNDNSH